MKIIEKIPPKLLGHVAWGMMKTITRTLRIETVNPGNDLGLEGGPVIYALWHGRLFFPLIKKRDCGIYVVVSEHRDGEIITKTLESAGFDTIRGSTTRGGARALAQVIRTLKKGGQIGFTPDGPQGPKWQFQAGAVYAAAKTGVPVVPLGGSAKRSYYFNSWDRFQLPRCFSQCIYVVGEPYYVTGGTDEENIEHHRQELERRLIEVNVAADTRLGLKSE